MNPAPEVRKRPSPDKKEVTVYLLDTSALFSFIQDETGADRVEQALKQKETLVPWMVLMETYCLTLKEEGQPEADRRFALIKQLEVNILYDLDETILLTASRLMAVHPLSMSDALIAAYAIRLGAVLVHRDPKWETLSGSLPMEALP
jgi:predicted nucleic acid-binding protein